MRFESRYTAQDDICRTNPPATTNLIPICGSRVGDAIVDEMQAVGLDADAAQIPVGVDGETVMMPTPVRCTIRPRALRVIVPRQRPGVPAAKPPPEWPRLRQLASFRPRPDGDLTPQPR